MAADFYAVLGIQRDADLSQIKRAFRTLTRSLDSQHDPASVRFREIQDAYDTLSDSSRRSEYERLLRQQEEKINPHRTPVSRAVPNPPAEPLTRRPMDLFGEFEQHRPSRDMLWD